MPGTLLIGYDVEDRSGSDVTPRFLERATALHLELGVPASLFFLGQTLDRWPDAARTAASAAGDLFDIQQHTYSHEVLKTLLIDDGRCRQVIRGSSVEEAREDVRRGADTVRAHLGVDPIGLTAPWCYYRGLGDRPDMLAVLREDGVRFVRSDGRDEHDWQPLPLDVQPYWYDFIGFPDILEIPTHGWHDCNIRRRIGWAEIDAYVAIVTPDIDRAAGEDLVYSLCLHDWAAIEADPGMTATRRILEHALGRGMRTMTCRAFYEERRGRRADPV
jgi:peptidoglycan/xylan/chitin deacetylase (PgdA/CDA1 family)